MLRETGPEGGKEINTESQAPEERRRRAKEPSGDSEGRMGVGGGSSWGKMSRKRTAEEYSRKGQRGERIEKQKMK